jgi:hypothetical protein
MNAALTSFHWTQIAGPTVALTQSGSPSNPMAQFTAPAGPVLLTFAIDVTNANGLSGQGTVSVAVDPDTVQIVNATFNNRRNRGRLNVVATSSLPPSTPGLVLTVQATNGTAQMAAQPLTMTRVRNTQANPTVCPATANPCWSFRTTGVLRYPFGTGFVPPAEITVYSSMGGTASSSNIRIR